MVRTTLFPNLQIYRSWIYLERTFEGQGTLLYVKDDAATTDKQDTVNGWGLRYQPHMIVLDQALGGYPAGTILLAGNSIPADLSKTQLDLYVSTDSGSTWKFVSHIANGGVAVSQAP